MAVSAFIERLEHCIDFIVLKEHTRCLKHRILQSLTGSEFIAETIGLTDLGEDMRIYFSGIIFTCRCTGNAIIADLFHRMGKVERIGSGIDRMRDFNPQSWLRQKRLLGS